MDEERVAQLRPLAQAVAKEYNQRVMLLRFRGKGREELEVYDPMPVPSNGR